jgi:CRP-like cAMP-binding protein
VSRSIIESSLADSGTAMLLDAGETLFREGEEPRGVYVLQSGQVDLLFASRKGEAKPLRVAQAGQILGLSCIVTNRPHDCTATAATPCRVGFIDSGAFQRVLTECPAVWFSVLRLLSTDVNAVYDDIRALAAR